MICLWPLSAPRTFGVSAASRAVVVSGFCSLITTQDANAKPVPATTNAVFIEAPHRRLGRFLATTFVAFATTISDRYWGRVPDLGVANWGDLKKGPAHCL